MNTQNSTNIKDVLRHHPRLTVITARELLRLGVSREAQRSFVRSGWLRRVGTGAYALLDEEIPLDGAIYALQVELGMHIHEGGFSALASKHGKAHNLVADKPVQLFCLRGQRVPTWFEASYGNLFVLYPGTLFPTGIGLVEYKSGDYHITISSAERSMMELLYLVPRLHTVQEGYQIMELLDTARPALVQSLLESCSSIKVKRLFLYMADLSGHAWLKHLKLSHINLGSGVREINKGGSLNHKYQLVIEDVQSI